MKSLSRKLFGTLRRIALPTILILLCTVGIAGAQSAQYGEYLDLFRKDGALASRINIIKKFELQGSTATAVTIDLKLQFISSFDLSIGGNAPKKWHWDRIKDFDSGGSDGGSTGSKSFILRVCDTTVPNEGSCRFTIVPHKSQMASDPGFCQNGVCNFPDQSTQSVGKIYHYTAVSQNGIPDEGVQNDKFNVVFNTKSFSTLQNGTLSAGSSLNDFMHIGDQKTYTLDMWYCAVKGTSALPTTEANSSIRFFNNLCGGNLPYIKIAETSFKLPTTLAEATAEAGTTGTTETVNTAPDRGDSLPGCSWTNGTFGSGTLMGCVARIVYYVVYWPIQWFAGLMGTLFDYFLGYSLSDSSYRAEFAVNGWKIVRDISNIFFIIILVWTGLSAVFNTEKTNMKHVIAQLILNALLINFSLFGTRVIIDLSNIVARVFYNSVHVCKGECKDTNGDSKFDNPLLGPGGYKSLSSKIVSSFNPQKIFSTETLDAAKSVRNVDNNVAARDDNAIAGYFIIVSLIASVIMFAVAMMFWKVAFMFIGRVVGLYVAMIFAPFAVLTKGGMPLVGGIKEISWGSWTKDLTNYALLAPIFVFFLYIIYSFLDTGFLKIITSDVDKSFFTTIISIAVPMLIVYFMMKQGVGIAKNLAGKIGEMVQSGAMKIAGVGVGVAAGGTALLGGRILGAAATRFNESRAGSWLRDKGKNSWFARRALEGVNKASAGSYDVRQTGLGKGLFSAMGINTDQKGLNALKGIGLGLGTDQRKGGYEADVKRRQEFKEKEAKLLEEKMSDDDIKKYNERQQKKYQEKVDSYLEGAMIAQFGKQAVETWKKDKDQTRYNKGKDIVSKDQKVQDGMKKDIAPAKEMKSSAEVTAARRKDFADNLKKASFIDKTIGVVPIVGSIIGSDVRKRADKKAAKKIEETTKVEKELADIESTLKKGFQDLIAVDLFQNSASFKGLTLQEQQDIIRNGTIQSGTRKGQGMYDILTDTEKARVDTEAKKKKDAMNTGTDAEKKKAKEEYEELEDLVKARESNRYNLKELREQLKNAKNNWINDPTNDSLRTAYREKLREVKNAEKHQSKYQDLNNYIKSRRDKLKGEDKK